MNTPFSYELSAGLPRIDIVLIRLSSGSGGFGVYFLNASLEIRGRSN